MRKTWIRSFSRSATSSRPSGVRADAVRQHELPRARADLAPAVQQLARRAEVVDPAVPVAVRDEDVPVGPDGDVGAPVERPGRPGDRLDVVDAHRHVGPVAGVRGRAGHAQGEQQLAVRGELADRVVAVVDAVHRAVGADRDAVRVGEGSSSPGPDERPGGGVHEHLVVVAGEQVHLVGGVDGHAGDVAVADRVGALLPVEVSRPAGLLTVHHADLPAGAARLSLPAHCLTDRQYEIRYVA